MKTFPRLPCWLFPAILFAVVAQCGCFAGDVDFADVGTKVRITGPLGKPLGVVMKIEGTWLLGANDGPLADAGRPFVMVTKVDGVALQAPVRIPLRLFSFADPVVSGAKPVKVVLTGYQDGEFHGMPAEAAKLMSPPPQTEGWGFRVIFQVVKVEPVPQEENKK